MPEQFHLEGFTNMQPRAAGPYWTLYEATRPGPATRHLVQVFGLALHQDAAFVALCRDILNLSPVLSHPAILAPVAFEAAGAACYFIYDFHDSRSLKTALDNQPALPERLVVSFIRQMAEVLQFVQIRGIRHGWISPEVILVAAASEAIKIFGFGSDRILAYLYDKHPHIAAEVNPYIPPENLGLPTQPETDDGYALGVLFYRLLLNQMPFRKDKIAELKQEKMAFITPPHRVNPQLTPEISELAVALFRPNPALRAGYNALLNVLSPQDNEVIPLDFMPEEFESGFGKMRRLVSAINPISRNLVGSKKRIANATLAVLLAMILIVSALVFSHKSTSDKQRLQAAYKEFVAEGEHSGAAANRSPETGETAVLETSENFAPDEDIKITPVEQKPVDERRAEQITETPPPVERRIKPVEEEPAKTTELSPRQPVVEARANLVLSVYAGTALTAAEIFLDGKTLGLSAANQPFHFQELTSGKTYTVSVIKDGYEPWERQVTMHAGGNSLRADLNALVVSTTVFTFAQVAFANKIRINDENMARNLPCNVPLSPGPIRVTYIDSRSDFSWNTTVELSPDKPKIEFAAEQVGVGEITVVLDNPIQYGYAFVKVNGEAGQHATPFRKTLTAGWHRVQVFRQDYAISPSDTSVFIRPDGKTSVRCKVKS